MGIPFTYCNELQAVINTRCASLHSQTVQVQYHNKLLVDGLEEIKKESLQCVNKKGHEAECACHENALNAITNLLNKIKEK